MLLGMEVGQATLCSMGTQLPPEKGHTQPSRNFWPMSIVVTRLDDQVATWYGVKHRLRRRCVRWGRSLEAPSFRFMSIVTKWLDG